MRVAIEQVDGKWPNLALAKLCAHHRSQGDEVGWYSPLEGADRIYASQVFTGSEPSPYLPPDTIWGGSGRDLSVRLPDEVECMRPDWSLWPAWDKDMGYSTRGCCRACPFCVVPKKEGKPRIVAEFYDLWSGHETLILLDPNVLATDFFHFRNLCGTATREGVTLDFSQGLDARLMSEDHAAVIGRARLARRIHLAFDHPRDEKAVRFAVDVLGQHDVLPSRLTFYVLIGFDTTPEEDMYRVQLLDSLGCDPFVMPFDKTDPYQRRFARWVNNKTAFKAMTWEQWLATFKTPLQGTP